VAAMLTTNEGHSAIHKLGATREAIRMRYGRDFCRVRGRSAPDELGPRARRAVLVAVRDGRIESCGRSMTDDVRRDVTRSSSNEASGRSRLRSLLRRPRWELLRGGYTDGGEAQMMLTGPPRKQALPRGTSSRGGKWARISGHQALAS